MPPRKLPSYLKLHTEEPAEDPAPRLEHDPELDSLCQAFGRATGWSLTYERGESPLGELAWSTPVASCDGQDAGRLIMAPASAGWRPDQGGDGSPPIEQEGASRLAEHFGRLLGELSRLRHIVWRQEAELAAGVPVTPRPDEEAHLAVRLEAVLRGGAEAVGCDAAGAYLLDDATSSLKLRAGWGLPRDRLLEPPRELRGAGADLEALLGHAVVLEDTARLPHWKPPEPFPAAVCVPISTPTTPLGTLWMFARHPREFSSAQTNIIEITAGRIAAELEREMLLDQGVQSRRIARQLACAADWQNDRLPSVSPLLDHWRLAGWTDQAEWLGGDFHDWSVLADGSLSVAVGDAEGELLEASLTAAALQTAVRSHAAHRHNARQLLARVNETLWTGSTGGQFASLFYGVIQPETGELNWGCAGRVRALLVRATRFELLGAPGPPLGADPDATFPSRKTTLRPGDVLAVLSGGASSAEAEQDRQPTARTIAREIRRRKEASNQQLLDAVKELLGARDGKSAPADQTVLIVQRRT